MAAVSESAFLCKCDDISEWFIEILNEALLAAQAPYSTKEWSGNEIDRLSERHERNELYE